LKVFIPSDIKIAVSKRDLFVMARPFYQGEGPEMKKWSLDESVYSRVMEIAHASLLILPLSINYYINAGLISALESYNKLCKQFNIKGYGYVSGDWGKAYPEFENLIYFRPSGFRSQLSELNQGFPVALSDHHLKIYGTTDILLRNKQEVPVIGFCGHASFSPVKRAKENLKFIIENSKRLIQNPLRKDWEPLFPSAYHRACVLQKLERSRLVTTNFIYREQYRAGARSESDLMQTTLEYYNNIRNSDYIVCVRGGGNFSVRLYETLMMGRIPVFLNTDCLLPFENRISWKEHAVWVEWKDRYKIDELVLNFHKKLSADKFRELQLRNRALWANTLSVKGIFEMLNIR
jgi:hypothetical protein